VNWKEILTVLDFVQLEMTAVTAYDAGLEGERNYLRRRYLDQTTQREHQMFDSGISLSLIARGTK
jgi:hypothetical protein